jgi:hypothetical protein
VGHKDHKEHTVSNRAYLRSYAKRLTERSFAFRASSSRLRGGALVLYEWINRRADAVTSSTAALNAASFVRDGCVDPLNFRTNCSADARISSSVAGGSKLDSVLMFLHIPIVYLIFLIQARIGADTILSSVSIENTSDM